VTGKETGKKSGKKFPEIIRKDIDKNQEVCYNGENVSVEPVEHRESHN